MKSEIQQQDAPQGMSEEARELERAYKRAYMKEWRKKNPDKVRANQRRYWERKAAKVREENKK